MAYTALLKLETVVGMVATSYSAPKHAPQRMAKLRHTPSGMKSETRRASDLDAGLVSATAATSVFISVAGAGAMEAAGGEVVVVDLWGGVDVAVAVSGSAVLPFLLGFLSRPAKRYPSDAVTLSMVSDGAGDGVLPPFLPAMEPISLSVSTYRETSYTFVALGKPPLPVASYTRGSHHTPAARTRHKNEQVCWSVVRVKRKLIKTFGEKKKATTS